MLQPKAAWLIVLLIGAWLLATCAPGTPQMATGDPASNQAESPTLAGGSSAAAGLPALPAEQLANGPVALAYNPADGSLLLVRSDGLYRWQTGAWASMALPQSSQWSAVVIHPDQPATIYASGLGVGVLRSDDGGANWQAIDIGLSSRDVTALALHSFQRETLFAWLKGDGIYRTEDGGANWVRLPDSGPADTDVRGLVHSTLPGSMNTGWLYASTPTGAYLSMDCF
jgi:photosystem II stability/assembly factor-like uncharacterized protein